MTGEIANYCLVLALCVAVSQAIIPMLGAAKNKQSWMAYSRAAAYTQWCLIAGAYRSEERFSRNAETVQ